MTFDALPRTHSGRREPAIGTLLAAGLLALGVAACEDSSTPIEPGGQEFTQGDVTSDGGEAPTAATLNRELAALRRTTARFHRTKDGEPVEALAADYTILVTHPVTGAACLEHPTDGAMGRHFLNATLVNDEVSVTEPEVVIYEPMSNGRLRLVGFEYIIPFAIRGPNEPPPVLFGQEFLHNPTFGVWMLHVYAWKHNPSGMFATWNPAITCEHDDAVD